MRCGTANPWPVAITRIDFLDGAIACRYFRRNQSRYASLNHFRAFSGFGMIKVSDRRLNGLQNVAMLPLLFSDHRESLDVSEVSDVKLDVLPQCSGFPFPSPAPGR